MTAVTINCLTTFWLLLTYEGLCGNCNRDILDYDWRAYVKYKVTTEYSNTISTIIVVAKIFHDKEKYGVNMAQPFVTHSEINVNKLYNINYTCYLVIFLNIF